MKLQTEISFGGELVVPLGTPKVNPRIRGDFLVLPRSIYEDS